MRMLKEHPWRFGLGGALVVALTATALVFYLQRNAAPIHVDEHAGHAGAIPASVDPHAGHGRSAAANMPDGFAPVALDPAQASAMGLVTEAVTERDLTHAVRTVGIVTVDETRTAHVHARVRAWIEGFHVQFVGRKVKQGEPLVSLFSQEVYAAQLELVSLLRSPIKTPELIDAARKRLVLWDVPRSVIEKVEASGEPQRTFPVLAPRSGVVVAKQAFAGQFIDPSIELYTITDLGRVWVLADIYESDVPHVKVGSVAKLTVEGQPKPIVAKIAFLSPTIDERTRTRKARIELANVDAGIMPGAFVTVELQLALERGLTVPETAVIRTGERAIVFVVHGTHAEPREIVLGPRVGEYFRVVQGLSAGEHVATGAQFLLDSESRLRASGGGGGHAH